MSEEGNNALICVRFMAFILDSNYLARVWFDFFFFFSLCTISTYLDDNWERIDGFLISGEEVHKEKKNKKPNNPR